MENFEARESFTNLCKSLIELEPDKESLEEATTILIETFKERDGKKLDEIKEDLSEEVKASCWTVFLSNIRYFIKKVCKTNYSYADKEDLMEELLSYGIDAALKFDFSKNVKFISFAENYIRKAMSNFNSAYIKNGYTEDRKFTEATNKIWKAFSEFKDEFGYEPSAEELSDIVDMKYKTVCLHLEHMRSTMCASIYSEFSSDDNDKVLADILGDTNEDICPVSYTEKMEIDIVEVFADFMNQIPEIDRTIYYLHMGIDTDKCVPNTKIAKRVGLSLEEVKNSENKTKEMIEKFLSENNYTVDFKNFDLMAG